MIIYTSTIRYNGPGRLDITIKTGSRIFAPTWEMVLKLKSLEMSQEEYTEKYGKMMESSYAKYTHAWEELLDREAVVLVCYCRPGNFCHRILLANKLAALGGVYKGEIGRKERPSELMINE
jgi:uncharacterized protein YeaO (DUF488 family)